MSYLENFATSRCVLAIMMMLLWVALVIVVVVGYFQKKNCKKEIWLSLSMFIVVLFTCSIMWPARIDENTETVTITHFDSTCGLNSQNEVHFEVNGEDHWVRLEDGQRGIYEMAMGKDVVLTYGRVYCIWDLIPGCCSYDENEWLYGGITLPIS